MVRSPPTLPILADDLKSHFSIDSENALPVSLAVPFA
jgi:hypothetical protein